MADNETLEQAKAALAEYFYEPQEDGSFVRFKAGFPRSMYMPLDDGFLCFQREDGVWAPQPYKIADRFKGVSGLTHKEQPECFDYVYPAAFILDEYSGAVERRDVYLAEHAAKRAEQAG